MIRNNQTVVDIEKATKKWSPIVEKLGVKDPERIANLCEYAEMHASTIATNMVKENAMYANAVNTAGMGAVSFPGLSGIPGQPGSAGSGDLGQTLLPAALKIAAQTIGLELVPTINVNSNRVDLLYWEWNYSDTAGNDGVEKPTVFKFTSDNLTTIKAWLRAEMSANGVTEMRGRISKPMYFKFQADGASPGDSYSSLTAPTGSKAGWLMFNGFSRIDDLPVFSAWSQENTASAGAWGFDVTLNSFALSGSIQSQLAAGQFLDTITSSGGVDLDTAGTSLAVSLVSLNEDFVDGFTTNGIQTGSRKAETRGQWDVNQAGKVGPNSFTKSVEIGVAHVSAALRLSEIGDWKRMYGVDVIEKTKAQLINQLSQQISVEIVEKIKEMGLKHRANTQAATGVALSSLASAGITDGKVYDFSTTAVASKLGGENSSSIARKLWAKVQTASFFIAQESRLSGADFVVCSANAAGILKSVDRYTLNPMDAKISAPGQLSPAGSIDGIKIYVDPYMNPADLTMHLGRIGKKEDPGIKFLAYMLAESVEATPERTMAPHLYLYSRYAVTEFGFFPELSYYSIKVEDIDGLLA